MFNFWKPTTQDETTQTPQTPISMGEEIVTLDASVNAHSKIQTMNRFGAYTVLVSDADDEDSGSSAVFQVVANRDKGGSIFRCAAVSGKFGEHLTLNWTVGEDLPTLKFMSFLPREGIFPKQMKYKVKWIRN